jgi:hypothetical protein
VVRKIGGRVTAAAGALLTWYGSGPGIDRSADAAEGDSGGLVGNWSAGVLKTRLSRFVFVDSFGEDAADTAGVA